MELPGSYLSADYSAVAVAVNPRLGVGGGVNRVVVVTPRFQAYNGCGSVYSEPCFFFAESFPRDSQEAVARFVAKWPDGDQTDGLVPDSLRFLSKGRIAFRSSGADGCCSIKRSWEMNLRTGAVKRTHCEGRPRGYHEDVCGS